MNSWTEESVQNYVNAVREHLDVLRACYAVRLTNMLKKLNTAAAKLYFHVVPVEQSTAHKTVEVMA